MKVNAGTKRSRNGKNRQPVLLLDGYIYTVHFYLIKFFDRQFCYFLSFTWTLLNRVSFPFNILGPFTFTRLFFWTVHFDSKYHHRSGSSSLAWERKISFDTTIWCISHYFWFLGKVQLNFPTSLGSFPLPTALFN